MTILSRLALLITLALGGLGGGPAVAQGAQQDSILFSVGPNFGTTSSPRSSDAVATLEWRPEQYWVWGTKPIWSLGVAGDGAFYVSGGVRGDFTLGRVLMTPHFSLALYQDGQGGFEAKELLQFRTGIDAFLPLGDRTMVGLGYYHLSNAQLTRRSADLDVVRLSLLVRY